MMQRLLDLVHFFTFTCHGSLNLWLSGKVNGQVVAMLRKVGRPPASRAFLIRFYRFLGGYAPNFVEREDRP